MKITISSIKFKIDQKLEEFIQSKIEKLAKHYEGVIGAEVILRLENSETDENKITEIRLLIKGNDLFAKKQCKTFEEATDSTIDALKKQLIKYKEKLKE